MTAMRIKGDPDLLVLFRLGMKAMEVGMETVTVPHYRNGCKPIGSFTLISACVPIKVSYTPSSAEGRRFSSKFSSMMKQQTVLGLTCIMMAEEREG